MRYELEEAMLQDKSNMEDSLCRVESCSEIWQNEVIRALCKAVFHLLEYALRKG